MLLGDLDSNLSDALFHAATQPCSHPAMQPSSHAATQPCSHAAKQRVAILLQASRLVQRAMRDPKLSKAASHQSVSWQISRSDKKTKREAIFSGFSWHTDNRTCFRECMAVFRAERKIQRKSAIAWNDTRFLADGIFLKWRWKVKYITGYNWFRRILAGKFKESKRKAWLLRGHRESFDPHLVAQGVGLRKMMKRGVVARGGCRGSSREAVTLLPKRAKKAEGPVCPRDAQELPMLKVDEGGSLEPAVGVEAGVPAAGAHVAEGAVAVNGTRNVVVDSVSVGEWEGETGQILAIVVKSLRAVAARTRDRNLARRLASNSLGTRIAMELVRGMVRRTAEGAVAVNGTRNVVVDSVPVSEWEGEMRQIRAIVVKTLRAVAARTEDRNLAKRLASKPLATRIAMELVTGMVRRTEVCSGGESPSELSR